MRKHSIIFAFAALVFFGGQFWLGYAHRYYDYCSCGLHRSWISFDDNPTLGSSKFLLHIKSRGNPEHQHDFSEFWFGKVAIFSWLGWIFTWTAIVLWFRPNRQDSDIVRFDSLATLLTALLAWIVILVAIITSGDEWSWTLYYIIPSSIITIATTFFL